MRPTLKVVADAAGVSPATVSKVLNNQPHVKASTRQRVLDAVERLNYSPSLLAQTLRNNRSRSIGVLLDRPIAYQWVAETTGAILEAANKAQLAALVIDTGGEVDRITASLTNLRRRHVEGYLYVGSGRDGPAVCLPEWSAPHVYLYCQPSPFDGPAFLVDDAQATDVATCHLLDLGHRRIAYIGGPDGKMTADERALGYRRALRRRGLEVDPTLVRVGPWSEETGYSAVFDLNARPVSFTAIVAANDFIAVGALHALQVLGRRVPHDVALIGVDDHVVGQLVRPRLSTVAQPSRDLGRAAARTLLDALSGYPPPLAVHRLPARLVIRESTGPIGS